MNDNHIVIDTDAYLGHFPFRKMFCNTAEELANIAQDNGIDKICVSSLEAVFYRNAMDGNLALIKEVEDFSKSNSSSVTFLPFAIINPHYTGFEKDIQTCRELGFYGIELCPLYHDYVLGDEKSQEAASLAAKHHLPIRIRAGFEDDRQRHFLDVPTDVPCQSVIDLITAKGEATYILTGFYPLMFFQKGSDLLNYKNVFFSTWKDDIYPSINDSFLNIIQTIPISQIVLGTNAPFAYMEPQFLRLHNCKELSEMGKKSILGDNIQSLFS
jgi:Predicted metal-dependent hydrolase of the TIM-barrel fold